MFSFYRAPSKKALFAQLLRQFRTRILKYSDIYSGWRKRPQGEAPCGISLHLHENHYFQVPYNNTDLSTL